MTIITKYSYRRKTTPLPSTNVLLLKGSEAVAQSWISPGKGLSPTNSSRAGRRLYSQSLNQGKHGGKVGVRKNNYETSKSTTWVRSRETPSCSPSSALPLNAASSPISSDISSSVGNRGCSDDYRESRNFTTTGRNSPAKVIESLARNDDMSNDDNVKIGRIRRDDNSSTTGKEEPSEDPTGPNEKCTKEEVKNNNDVIAVSSSSLAAVAVPERETQNINTKRITSGPILGGPSTSLSLPYSSSAAGSFKSRNCHRMATTTTRKSFDSSLPNIGKSRVWKRPELYNNDEFTNLITANSSASSSSLTEGHDKKMSEVHYGSKSSHDEITESAFPPSFNQESQRTQDAVYKPKSNVDKMAKRGMNKLVLIGKKRSRSHSLITNNQFSSTGSNKIDEVKEHSKSLDSEDPSSEKTNSDGEKIKGYETGTKTVLAGAPPTCVVKNVSNSWKRDSSDFQPKDQHCINGSHNRGITVECPGQEQRRGQGGRGLGPIVKRIRLNDPAGDKVFSGADKKSDDGKQKDQFAGNSNGSVNDKAEEKVAEQKPKLLLTNFAYRETSNVRGRGRGVLVSGSRSSSGSQVHGSKNMGLVRVKPDASTTPICPTFLRGIACTNERCTKRHDVPVEASTPLCLFFQRNGQCLKRDTCPFRHVKVNVRATVCPSFAVLGYCEDKDCVMKHVRTGVTGKMARESKPGAV